jgi:hypothetical protein
VQQFIVIGRQLLDRVGFNGAALTKGPNKFQGWLAGKSGYEFL